MKKLAVVFPGVGYTSEMPLLYYAGKLAERQGYEVLRMEYSGFQKGMRGNAKLMREAAESAYLQAEDKLQGIIWEEYEDILFIAKSVGTVVCSMYMKNHGVEARCIAYTPVDGTFPVQGEGIMFHGTKDPWVEKEETVQSGCRTAGYELIIIPGANHSLETGDVLKDIRILQHVMEQTENFL